MDIDDLTLDELRPLLAPLVAENAVFDGWTDDALAAAAAGLGIPPERARLVFPRGALDMIDAWYASTDAAMAAAFPPERIATLKMRDRIRALVRFRLDHMEPIREAARRALAVLALPQNLAAGTRLGWRAADAIWRLAGDTATDFNHYTKRATLAGVYLSTLMVWLGDRSADGVDTAAFLDRRIDDVMKIEAAKARWRGNALYRPSLTRFLGRLRYPAV